MSEGNNVVEFKSDRAWMLRLVNRYTLLLTLFFHSFIPLLAAMTVFGIQKTEENNTKVFFIGMIFIITYLPVVMQMILVHMAGIRFRIFERYIVILLMSGIIIVLLSVVGTYFEFDVLELFEWLVGLAYSLVSGGG